MLVLGFRCQYAAVQKWSVFNLKLHRNLTLNSFTILEISFRDFFGVLFQFDTLHSNGWPSILYTS